MGDVGGSHHSEQSVSLTQEEEDKIEVERPRQGSFVVIEEELKFDNNDQTNDWEYLDRDNNTGL